MEEIIEIAKIIKIILSDQIDKTVWTQIDERLDTIIERYESVRDCRERCLNATETKETVCESGRPDEGGMADREDEDRTTSSSSCEGGQGH